MGSFIPNTSRGLKFLPIKEAIKKYDIMMMRIRFHGSFCVACAADLEEAGRL